MGSRWLRNGFIYLLILVAVVAIVYSFFGRSSGVETLTLTQVFDDARSGTIDELVVKGNTVTAKLAGEDQYKVQKEEGSSMVELLEAKGIDVGGDSGIIFSVENSGGWGSWVGLFINFLPLILFGAILIFFMHPSSGCLSMLEAGTYIL